MRRRFERALDSAWILYAAIAISLTIGLFFIFVWAPHPWGWEGFDHYHEIALELSRGRPFPTMDVPWGYAYFLAAFYRAFGARPWIPLVVQVALNATVPLLTFVLARAWCNRRTAALAALLTAVFSFNTIYASTESSDALCTVLFLAAIVAFARGLGRRGIVPFAIAGVLCGIAMQFRPNLILVPLLLAGYAIGTAIGKVRSKPEAAGDRDRLWTMAPLRTFAQGLILLGCAGAVVAPWIVRNYRLTAMLLPTSVHGAVQLWYGTLQVGPALHSRAANPRSVFEAPAFDYTSLEQVPVIVEGQLNCTDETLEAATLAYWSDHDRTERRSAPVETNARHFVFEIPAQRQPTVLYYYFVTRWSAGATTTVRTTPISGAQTPYVYFVSDDHLGDLDRHGDLLDIFDVVRLMRGAAWNEPVRDAARLAAVGVTDPRTAVLALLPRRGDDPPIVPRLAFDADSARLTFADGSSVLVPHLWHQRITDLTFTEGVASTLMTTHRSLSLIAAGMRPVSSIEACTQFTDVAVNQVFYRREPQMMQRYAVLAFDNIRRDPGGFALAAAYRAARLFVIQGTSERSTAQQFSGSSRVYAAATAISIVYATLFVAGAILGWKRGDRIGLPLLLIAYIPATLAPVLTNMRYTITVQPLMFVFMAIAIAAILGISTSNTTATAGHQTVR
jgi:hypothetical protein